MMVCMFRSPGRAPFPVFGVMLLCGDIEPLIASAQHDSRAAIGIESKQIAIGRLMLVASPFEAAADAGKTPGGAIGLRKTADVVVVACLGAALVATGE